MKELTEENYNYLTPNFEGIIVSIPTSIGYNADLYVYGNRINTDNKIEISCMAYNMEDGAINGFSYFGNTDFQSIFRDFKYMKHYQFENLNEFCNWYLHKDDKLKESIKDFKKKTKEFEERQNFHTVELDSIIGTSFADKLKENIGKKKKVTYFEQKYGFNPYETDTPEELCYWEIYNDENCDNELKRIIEKKWPEIKELASLDAKIIKNKISSTYTFDEIRDKINPGWNTRREKLADVLKLLELRDLRQNTIDMLMENMTPEKRCYLEKQLERDDKRIEDFLNEEV